MPRKKHIPEDWTKEIEDWEKVINDPWRNFKLIMREIKLKKRKEQPLTEIESCPHPNTG